MDEPSIPRAIWTLQQNSGEVRSGKLQARVDVARPQLGMQGVNVAAGIESLLSVRRTETAQSAGANTDAATAWPLTISDSYVRGSDLVATYQSIDAWPYAPQLYWRAGALDAIDGVVSSISLWVSVQTPLLDTHPRISVVSNLAAESSLLAVMSERGEVEVQPATTQQNVESESTFCIIRRLPNAPLSYIEFVVGSDCSVLNCEAAGGRMLTEWRLFSEFLEKGVIRRARVQAAFVDRTNDVELALECCQAMRDAPLPLTT